MARNKFLTTIAGLLNKFSNHRKSPTSQGSGGYVHRQKSDGENDLTRYLTKYFKNFSKIYQSLLPSAESENRQNPSRRWRRLMQHKLGKSFINLLQTISQLGRYFSVKAFYRLWRNFFVAYRQRTQAGFVLPVTVLMVVMMLLVVTSLMFRASQRSEQVIGDYQLQQVKNTSTPAIERAKAKIERLFSDQPGGVYSVTSDIPPESLLEQLLADVPPTEEEPNPYSYTWTGETRLEPADLGITGSPEGFQLPAWKFESDSDGDGTNDTVTAYAILVRSARAEGGVLKTMDHRLAESDQTGTYEEIPEEEKSKYFVVSNGPIITGGSTDAACQPRLNSEETDASNTFVQGWFAVGGGDAILKKNIQVYAVSLPKSVTEGNLSNPVISTAQYQQDRSFERANKWGAWFRTDIEINPSAALDWAGAMHTEGSMYINGQRDFNGNLISKQNSCFFNPKQNSDITIGGHLVKSLMINNQTFNGAANFRLHPDDTNIPVTNATDSSKYTGSPIDLSIDPKIVLLQNRSVARGGEGFWENQVDDPKWSGSELANKRVSILQSGEAPPYIDDTYRADNRYGPKVGYSQKVTTPQCNMGTKVLLTGGSCEPTPSVEQVIRNEPPDEVLQPDDYGLDGYWERRARGQGTRIIVGQRLELGNAFGWVQDLSSPADGLLTGSEDKKYGDDPLNPPDGKIINANMTARKHELRQRRTQYDNLAAVQSTLVYHHTGYPQGQNKSYGYDPVAVVATTVHPGTVDTLKNSATFETITFKDKDGKEQKPIAIDFFNGYGTNGWEFETPEVTNITIGTGKPLGKALRNLAYFAGDFNGDNYGAFPPTQENGRVHPDPQVTMWGNFSNLRRIFEENITIELPKHGDTGNISLADLTTLQTASSTLGMLAYNINYLQSYDYEKNKDSGLGGGIEDLGEALWKLQDGDKNNGEVIDLDAISSPTAINYNLPPDAYVAALERDRDKLGIDDGVIKLARLVMTKEQVERDRIYGFKVSDANHPENQKVNGIDPYNATLVDSSSPIANKDVTIACDVTATGNNYFGMGKPTIQTDEQRFIGMSRLCSNLPKFPSLYYIFPTVDHGHAGIGDHQQPNEEPYIQDTYIKSINSGSDLYKALSNGDIEDILIKAKTAENNLANWVLPRRVNSITPTNKDAAPNDSQKELIKIDDKIYQVGIKDSALFNGREEMSVRVLNLDIDLLRSTSVPSDQNETFLPNSGIMYVFREDAVREDAIARPGGAQMNAYTPTDPTLQTTGMSTKAIDYYADPDRRPYGFRLKNGQDLRRRPNGTLNTSILRGLTLVSDNPVYIQGNFNLHTSNGTDVLKEFMGTGNTLDSRFANPEVDYWRPTEILGDAITVISNNFCDGSIQEGYLNTGPMNTNINDANTQNKYGCFSNTAPQRTSYSNQNRPRTQLFPQNSSSNQSWVLSNPWEAHPTTSTSPKSPIVINKNGEVLITDRVTTTSGPYIKNQKAYDQQYNAFSDRSVSTYTNYIGRALTTRTNLTMINGVVPAQTNQGNGGLINFPRMLEDWLNGGEKTLAIDGSFMQLNFSQYATGPFDQDAWEPGSNPVSTESIFYYARPRREWGYDVGLQYLPASPVARRIVVPNDQRNEFYREPKGDDPYICQLRKALNSDFACN